MLILTHRLTVSLNQHQAEQMKVDMPIKHTNGANWLTQLHLHHHMTCISLPLPSYLHHAQSLRLLHLAQNGSEDLVQLFPELGPRPRDQSGHQPAHEGSGELGGAGVQQLVDHLHDVPEAAVPLLVPPLGDLLQGDRDVRPQALATVLETGGRTVWIKVAIKDQSDQRSWTLPCLFLTVLYSFKQVWWESEDNGLS